MPRGRLRFNDITLSKLYDLGDASLDGALRFGGGGNEVLEAKSDADWWIEGRGGADLILGAAGDDLLVAGKVLLGDAATDGDPDTDDAVGATSVPSLGTAPGHTTIDGGAGDDLIIGALGNEVLRGGAGNDIVIGLGGADEIFGGDGDDLLMPGFGNATVDGGAGIDTLRWADIDAPRGRGALPGVVLNLSDRLIRYDSGDQVGEGRILVQEPTGGFVLLGEADTAPTRPHIRKGTWLLDVGDGTAAILIGLLLPAVQKMRAAESRDTIERFEGTAGLTDVAVLEDGFASIGTTADGWARYARGAEVLEFKGFEVILIA